MKLWHFLLILLILQTGNTPATAVRIDDDRSWMPVFRDTSTAVAVIEGDDWSLPAWSLPAWSQPLDNRRFHSEGGGPGK